MPFGILEDRKLDSVPGTALLATKGNQPTIGDASGLKRGTGKYSHIVLIPQPSDDPCDPLNWPRWKKEVCFWMLVFTSSLSGTLTNFASSGFFSLAKEFRVSVDEVASSFCASFAGTAVFLLLQLPISIKYGHRIVYLLSIALMFMTCVWAALSQNLVSIRISRVFQGFGVAAGRCLIANTIEHLFFVHQRGSRSCMWIMLQNIGITIGFLSNGYVIKLLSWRAGFWFASIACGVCFIGVLLFVPETTYCRQLSPSTAGKESVSEEHDLTEKMPTANHHVEPNVTSSSPATLLSHLKIYNGTFSDASLWSLFLRPLPFIFSPVTWFAFFSVSVPSVCIIFIAVCSSTIFTVTYGFDAGQIGLITIGNIVAIILALVFTGPLNDWWVVWMARRNRGIYEPEYRLVFMLSMLFGVFGYLGWAIGNDHHMPWIGAVACLAMVSLSLVVSSSTVIAYVIDTHGANASHIVALSECAVNLISFGATFFANGVVLSAGVKRTLLVVAACQAACWVTCIPMYVYGKRARSFIARHPRLFPAHADLSPSETPNLNLKPSESRTQC
ncbi:MFS general substrate transporter [Ganoderma sinense ZZ0214-1]|uniref:MFS general substrate transporter n=1 Tax=Ganoderma sinense ZZ0214-1 TaxID=1077348 RepID=A0A2G8SBC2_9APHY|nr:MFS general substrate transporter [Ganoderma sinense ZZ0214-1]